MAGQWYHTAYRRNVVDMHITDDDERFLSEFDPQRYVAMLVEAQVQSAVVYAHSHVGLCNYPTKIGRMHGGLKGRDIFREVVDLCHQQGIHVVAYLSAIFDTWAYRNHPEWRIMLANGGEAARHSRYGICCPNSPYRDYVAAIVEEICRGYDVQGVRIDMTFWPTICYCAHCQRRFAEETGGELPKVVDWEKPHWVGFQRKREEWLVEFATHLTGTVKRLKPDVTVEHQASTYILSWQNGVTDRLAAQNDFLQGDFYGDALQGSFVRKLFHNLSENLPYGFETSFSVSLNNHTARKPHELLEAKACAALADGGAFVFIDAVDPVGTMNPSIYERMGSVFRDTQGYEPYVGGELCQDVAIYLSTESKYDPSDSGKPVDGPLSGRMPHVEACVHAAQVLIEHHIPFGVITRRNISQLSKHQIVVLPNVLMMDNEEVESIRDYVRCGGNLYASGGTSLLTKDSIRHDDFLLRDIFGVSPGGLTQESFTYVAPTDRSIDCFDGYTMKYPLGINSKQMLLNADADVEVLGELVLPYTDPSDPIHFASIHSNPPGVYTGSPAIVRNRFGTGQAIYSAVTLENSEISGGIFINLLRQLTGEFSFEMDAPKSVEMTLYHQKTRQRLLISLVNFQKQLPNIPVDDISVRVRLNGRSVKRLIQLPHERDWEYEVEGNTVLFRPPRLATLLMFGLDYV